MTPADFDAVVAKARKIIPDDYELVVEPTLVSKIMIRHKASSIAGILHSGACTGKELSNDIASAAQRLVATLGTNKIDHAPIPFLKGGKFE